MSDSDLAILMRNLPKGVGIGLDSFKARVIEFASIEAKDNFQKCLFQLAGKSAILELRGYTCGQCAAYPCFRNTLEEEDAGLCFQNVRQCRQECPYFVIDENSGKSPDFVTRGSCRRDGTFVCYDSVCRFLGKSSQ